MKKLFQIFKKKTLLEKGFDNEETEPQNDSAPIVQQDRKFRFDYIKVGGQSESFEVKYYNFVSDFIRLTLLDGSEVVLTSKDTVLDRFTIKEIVV